jgi:hypothetical protein
MEEVAIVETPTVETTEEEMPEMGIAITVTATAMVVVVAVVDEVAVEETTGAAAGEADAEEASSKQPYTR